MIELWPNFQLKYTCMDLQGVYAMDLLKTTVEKPLITPGGAGGGVTEETLNKRLDTLRDNLLAKITANEALIASTRTQASDAANKVAALEPRVTALENKPAGTGAQLLVLGPTEAVPVGTKPGTVIVRRSN